MLEPMRRPLLFLAIALPLLILGGLGRDSAPEGPVRVVTGDPVRVVLSANPTAQAIRNRTAVAITQAALDASSVELREEWKLLAVDAAALAELASRAEARFSSGEAVALAFPMFRVDARSERLTIAALTIEIIPGRPNIAVSRDHEDGHAEVHDQVALRCGPAIAHGHIAAGRTGRALETSVKAELDDLANSAHTIYHEYVEGARVGTHIGFARDASSEVAAARCS